MLGYGAVSIVDYKTGTVPDRKELQSGLEPQLTLEAAMAAAGAFGPVPDAPVFQLEYWKLTGGAVPGERHELFKGKPEDLSAAVEAARDGLMRLVARFDDPDEPYLSHPSPVAVPRFSDYAQLARVAEWAAAPE